MCQETNANYKIIKHKHIQVYIPISKQRTSWVAVNRFRPSVKERTCTMKLHHTSILHILAITDRIPRYKCMMSAICPV